MYLTDRRRRCSAAAALPTDCDVRHRLTTRKPASFSRLARTKEAGGDAFQDGRLWSFGRPRPATGYDPRVGTPRGFHSEMAALSDNFLVHCAVGTPGRRGCDSTTSACGTVRPARAHRLQRPGSAREHRHLNGRISWLAAGAAPLQEAQHHGPFDFTDDPARRTGASSSPGSYTLFGSKTWNLLQGADVYNLTVSVDRPTFVNFLNANRTFFVNAQLFVRYLPHYDRSYDTNGPFTALGTLAIATGYFQDRLLPSLVLVHDLKSASGGVIFSMTYRFTESFSATFGVLGFYGEPRRSAVPLNPIALPSTVTKFTTHTRFEGLSAIAERDRRS
jgi:hypothetical protein